MPVRPDDVLRHLAVAEQVLIDDLLATDFDPSRPSLLPGWTIGHVVTHLARNADPVTGMLRAAADGMVGAQWGGVAATIRRHRGGS